MKWGCGGTAELQLLGECVEKAPLSTALASEKPEAEQPGVSRAEPLGSSRLAAGLTAIYRGTPQAAGMRTLNP